MDNHNLLSEDEIARIRANSTRPQRDGEEAFRVPWELRGFALGVACHESSGFPWNDFQSRLITAIETSHAAEKPEQYYARWIEALETLLSRQGGLDIAELDRRTQQILATPRDDTHQHAHYDPITVPAGHQYPLQTPRRHGHDHDHDH